ncbi:MAG: hypothetical protein OHK0056_29760 [Bacteriovoracaceae bacterium]
MFGESVGSLSEQLKKAKQAKDAKKEEAKPIRAEYVQEIKSPSEYRVEERAQARKVETSAQEDVQIKQRRIATPKPTQHVYPERMFDQFERKTTWLRGEDIDVLKAMASEIMSGRKRAQIDCNGMNRVTDNNIIRLLVQSFCEKVSEGLDSTDFSKIQSEGEIKNYIENVMRF